MPYRIFRFVGDAVIPYIDSYIHVNNSKAWWAVTLLPSDRVGYHGPIRELRKVPVVWIFCTNLSIVFIVFPEWDLLFITSTSTPLIFILVVSAISSYILHSHVSSSLISRINIGNHMTITYFAQWVNIDCCWLNSIFDSNLRPGKSSLASDTEQHYPPTPSSSRQCN
ncbi:hypothetical protein L211DRAFT_15484 [Terfezia boudieri ATCC MYA-4762]|uniref:Uncharacterized protein n=1 Tax=Terfezia boudieri ATCC MYA-4762 TaxID=1051890 RepID=A0A3N4MNS1_9PEZI|nr:hypothetical protein L211DRAFT_15484 [Terfezia boudieri ATCC MYA-4762]